MQGSTRSGQFKPDEFHEALRAAKNAMGQRRFDEARNLFAQSVSLFPQSLQALSGLGSCLIECGEPQKAVEPLRTALNLSYYDPDLHALAARALAMSGQNREAAKHLIIAKIFASKERQSPWDDLLLSLPRETVERALDDVKRLGLALPFDERGRQTTAIAKGRTVLDPGEEERRIAQVKYWHHEFILPSGRKIPGRAGNMLLLGMLDLPESLEGKKVLDIAAWDGFLSFECESRGALSVTALDWLVWRDQNIGDRGFLTMRKVLDSSTDQVLCDAYDLDPRKLGIFDVTLMCGLLYHLHDPLRALQALASVTGEVAYIGNTIMDTGECESWMRYSPGENNHYDDFTTWWVPNTRCMIEMARSNGFERVEVAARTLDASTGHGYIVLRAYPRKRSFREFYLEEHPFISEEDWRSLTPKELELIQWATGENPSTDSTWLDPEDPLLKEIPPAPLKTAFFNLRNAHRNDLGIRLVRSWLAHQTNYEVEGILKLYGEKVGARL